MSTVSQKVPHGYCQSVQAQGVQKWPSCDRIRTIGWGAKKKEEFQFTFLQQQHTKKRPMSLYISQADSFFHETLLEILGWI